MYIHLCCAQLAEEKRIVRCEQCGIVAVAEVMRRARDATSVRVLGMFCLFMFYGLFRWKLSRNWDSDGNLSDSLKSSLCQNTYSRRRLKLRHARDRYGLKLYVRICLLAHVRVSFDERASRLRVLKSKPCALALRERDDEDARGRDGGER